MGNPNASSSNPPPGQQAEAADACAQADAREAAQYEDLRSSANRAMWTIDLQIRRLQQFAADLEAGNQFVLQPVSDAEFLILSLDRLLAVSRLIEPMIAGALGPAIAAFERELPHLRSARNVVSHIDEYLTGKGRNRSVSIGSISATILDTDRLQFAGFDFNLTGVRVAAEAMFSAIQSNIPASVRNSKCALR